MSSPAQVKIDINQFNLLTGTILLIIKPTVKLDQIKLALELQEEMEAKGKKKRIGELLIEMGAITEEHLDLALKFQKFIKEKFVIKADIVSIKADINYSL